MYNGLSLLRGIAAIGIVGCHLSLSPRTNGGEWVTALCDCNVALFAAISGFLMPVVKSGMGYVRKRAFRLLPAYFVWSLSYCVATVIFDLLFDGGALNDRYYSLSNWIGVLFWGRAATHLWFLICLFYGQVLLHCANVVFQRIGMNGDVRDSVYLIVSIGLLMLSIASSNWYCHYPVRLMAFLMLGHVLKAVRRDMFWLPLSCALIMVGIHCLGRGFVEGFVRDYLLAVPVIVLFCSSRFRENKIVTLLASTSMGVYLVHPLFARGISLVIMRTFDRPYNAFVVIGEWLTIWMVSICFVIYVRRFLIVRRLIT